MRRVIGKISNFISYLRFIFHKIPEKTVLLVEINNYHTELFPSFAYYLKSLGYSVDIMANFGQIGNLPELDAKNIYYFTLSGFKKALLSDKIKEYDYLIFTSNEIYWSYGKEIEPKANVLEKFPVSNTKQLNIITTIHDTLETLPDDNIGRIILSDILNSVKKSFVVNPCYFKDIKPASKNKKTVFVTVGKLENIRKSSDLLFDNARKLIKDGIRNFEIKIIGNNDKRIIPEDLRNFIKILGHINFNKMYKELENADFYLPLLNPEIESHKRYIETGTSGSFQLIRGFLLPPIIDKTFAIPHNFNEENSIIYENDFSEALKKSVTLKDEDYLNLQKKLLKDRERIIEKSVFELEKLLKSLISR